jgi:hypothetical protein
MRDTRCSTLSVNAQADAVGALLNGGFLRIYGGQKPADADALVLGDPLAVLRFAPHAFRLAEEGVITSMPITPDTNTLGGGEPTWFRACAPNGDPVFDGTVGRSDCNLNIPGDGPLIVHAGGEFHVGSITYVVRKGAQ